MQYISVELSDGSVIQVQCIVTGEQPKSNLVSQKLKPVLDKISTLASDLKDAVKGASPDKLTLEMGVDIGVKDGGLTAMILRGNADINLKITLEWNRENQT